MIKGVLGQPNFSPQTNTTQLFPKINTNFNNLSSVKVNTIMSVVLSWTNGTSLNFLGKRNRKFEFFVLCLFGEKSWVGPEPLLSYYYSEWPLGVISGFSISNFNLGCRLFIVEWNWSAISSQVVWR